jgi:hypothetical protein
MADLKVGIELDDQKFKQSITGVKDQVVSLGATGSSLEDQIGSLEQAFNRASSRTDNYKASLRQMTGAITNMTVAYRGMSDEEKNSAFGRRTRDSISSMVSQAAELKDTLGDVKSAIKNSSSDTLKWDAAKDSLGMLTGEAQAAIGVFSQLTGNTNAGVAAIAGMQSAEGGLQGVILAVNNAQSNSNIMRAAGTAITSMFGTATTAAAMAQTALNVAMKANVFIAVAGLVLSLATALKSLFSSEKDATGATGNLTEEQKRQQEQIKRNREEIRNSYVSTLTDLMTTYTKLRSEYKSLRNEHQRTEWINNNKESFHKLGIEVYNTRDAENVFAGNTSKIVKAFVLRAQAAAYAAAAAKEFQAAIELESKKKTSASFRVWKTGDTLSKEELQSLKGQGLKNGVDYNITTDGGAQIKNGASVTRAAQAVVSSGVKAFNDSLDKQAKVHYDRGNSYISKSVSLNSKADSNFGKYLYNSNSSSTGGSHTVSHISHGSSNNTGNKDNTPVKEGTVDWYEKDIKKQEELRDSTVTTSNQYDSYTEKIKKDKEELSKITGETSNEPKEGSENWYDDQIDKLSDKKKNEAISQEDNKNYQDKIDKLTQDRDIKFHPEIQEGELKSISDIIDNALKGDDSIDLTKKFDFSGLSESLQQEANKAVKQLDKIKKAEEELKKIQKDPKSSSEQKNKATEGLKKLGKEYDTTIKKVDTYGKQSEKSTKKAAKIKGIASVVGDVGSTVGQLGNIFSNMGDKSTAAFMQIASSTLDATATAIPAIMSLIGAKEGETMANGTAQAAKLGFPENIAAIATVVAAVLGVVGTIASTVSKHANGGIIGGASKIGDWNLARVNAGEMILNDRQQSNLFSLLDGSPAAQSSRPISHTIKVKGQDLYLTLHNLNGYKKSIGKDIGIK